MSIQGLVSLKVDWFDLLAVQGTVKSLLQHNLKASVLHCSAFFLDLEYLMIKIKLRKRRKELSLRKGRPGFKIN